MKKVKTEDKELIHPFFEYEYSAEVRSLNLTKGFETSKTETVMSHTLKQVFLFLPGTFLLYLIGFIGTIVLIDSFSVSEPLEIFGVSSVPLQMLLFGTIAVFGTFMTWFGLGDIKNKKHFSIPASILATGGILALISKILGDVFNFTGIFEAMNYYFIYLFPVVLIVPILVKASVDKKTED